MRGLSRERLRQNWALLCCLAFVAGPRAGAKKLSVGDSKLSAFVDLHRVHIAVMNFEPATGEAAALAINDALAGLRADFLDAHSAGEISARHWLGSVKVTLFSAPQLSMKAIMSAISDIPNSLDEYPSGTISSPSREGS